MDRVKRYRRGAYLEVALAVLTIPYLVVGALCMAYDDNPSLRFSFLGIAFCGAAVSVYLWLLNKDLLNHAFNFSRVDKLIYAMVVITAASFLSPVVGLAPAVVVLFIVLAVSAVNGIVTVKIGFMIRNCESDMFGYRNNISLALILIGALGMTIVLIPVAELISIAFCINMAKVYFAASDAMRDRAVVHT